MNASAPRLRRRVRRRGEAHDIIEPMRGSQGSWIGVRPYAAGLRGIGGVIAQYPDADMSELREALLDATRALLRAGRRRPHATPSTANATGT
jgi:hypothetical protein